MSALDSNETLADTHTSPNRPRRVGSFTSQSFKSCESTPQEEKADGTLASNALDADRIIVRWDENDSENPHNWSQPKKTFVLFMACMLVVNSTMSSALPCMAMPQISKDFTVTSAEEKVLPISIFLVGYVFGPIIWAPLSEHYGRRNITLGTFLAYLLFTAACALAPNWSALLGFRLCCGIFASSPVANGVGLLADVYGEPRSRGRAYSAFMVTTVFGPIFGPIVSGFSSPSIGWRWAFWIAVIYAGVTFLLLFFLPETYGPVLLIRRARKLRLQEQRSNVFAPRELENNSLNQLLRKVLTRPLRMLFLEPIVAATCAYQALAYAIFYMSFQAFPIIFMHQYGLSPGVSGLCYLPIAAGAVLSMLSFWAWDGVVGRAKARGAEWASREEYRRVPLATIGGPMFVMALFWLGFTSRPGEVSFVVPMLSGLPFGMGFQLILMSLLNYLTDAYATFAASANAAASTTRSLLAVVLPLATKVMFDRLGIAGACATLGGISAAMCAIPFIFLWKGHVLRERSTFCTALRKQQEVEERERQQRQQRRAASGAKVGEVVT